MMLEAINRHNFEKEVLKSKRSVLVNFWVDGSEACQKMRKLMTELDELDNHKKSYKIVEINWHAESELASQYHVFGTPSLLIFRNGKLLSRYSGALNFEEFWQSMV